MIFEILINFIKLFKLEYRNINLNKIWNNIIDKKNEIFLEIFLK